MIDDLNVIQALESELRAEEDQYLESSGKSSLKEGTDLPLKGWSDDGTKMEDGGTLVEKKGNTIFVRAGTDVNGKDDSGRTFLYPSQLGIHVESGQSYTLSGELNPPIDRSNLKEVQEFKDRISMNLHDSSGREVSAAITLSPDGKSFTAKFNIPKGFAPLKLSIENYKGSDYGVGFSNLQLDGGSGPSKTTAQLAKQLLKDLAPLKEETERLLGELSAKVEQMNKEIAAYNKMPGNTKVEYDEKEQAYRKLETDEQNLLIDGRNKDEKTLLGFLNLEKNLGLVPKDAEKVLGKIAQWIVDNRVMKKLPPYSPLIPPQSPRQAQTDGSGMTDQEEWQSLEGNPTVMNAINSALAQYKSLLDEYYQGKISWTDLQTARSKIFDNLNQSIRDIIGNGPISKDYDTSHQTQYTAHISFLLANILKDKNVSASDYFMPPKQPSNNQLKDGYDNGITLGPNQKNTQTINMIKGHTYLVYGYVDPNGSITIKGPGVGDGFAQSTNGIFNGKGQQARFFWVTAQETGPVTVTLTASKEGSSTFRHIGVEDLTAKGIDVSTNAGKAAAMAEGEELLPPILVTGYQAIGHFPQIEKKLENGDNLIDGGISFQDNVDQSPGGTAGHPYWYLSPGDGTKIVNGLNGAHHLILPTGANPSTDSMVPVPAGDYQYSFDVPPGTTGKIRIDFSGSIQNTNGKIPKSSFEVTIQPGQTHYVVNIPKSAFPQPQSARANYRPNIGVFNQGNNKVEIENSTFVPDPSSPSEAQGIYDAINRVNPYNPDSPWYGKDAYSKSYDFTKGAIDQDWGIIATGNQMLSPDPNLTKATGQGIEISNKRNADGTFSNGGIEGTHMIPGGRDFNISISFTANTSDPNYKPTLALWTYGETQKGFDNPNTHTMGAGMDKISELDIEYGSNSGDGSVKDGSYVRNGSYTGFNDGGHNEHFPVKPGTDIPDWPKAPVNIWDGKPHTMTLSGTYDKNGDLIVTREIDGKPIGQPQNLGHVVLSDQTMRFGIENPTWNSASQGKSAASASVDVTSAKVSEGPQLYTPPSLDTTDWAWYASGNNSYTPFPGSEQ